MSDIERRTFLGVVAASPLLKFFHGFLPAAAAPVEDQVFPLRLEVAPLESFEPPAYKLQYRPILESGWSGWIDLEYVETEPARGGALPVRATDEDGLEVSFEVSFADDFGEDKLEPGRGYEFRVVEPRTAEEVVYFPHVEISEEEDR